MNSRSHKMLVLVTGALALLSFLVITQRPVSRGDGEPNPSRPTADLSACGDWIPKLVTDEKLRVSYERPAWDALRMGRPSVALQLLQQPPKGDAISFALWWRSAVELADVLMALRRVQHEALTKLLDRLLAVQGKLRDHGRLQEASALTRSSWVPLLRALVSVEQGEFVPLTPWLDQLPPGDPLQPVVAVLRSMPTPVPPSSLGIRDIQRADHAAQQLEPLLPKLHLALQSVGAPWTGDAQARLSWWVTQHQSKPDGTHRMPPPGEWYQALRLSEPALRWQQESLIEGGVSSTSALFETLWLTVLAEQWTRWLTQEVSTFATSEDLSHLLARVWTLHLHALRAPEQARVQACELERILSSKQVEQEKELLPWLVFGDFSTLAELKMQLQAQCQGPAVAQTLSCPELELFRAEENRLRQEEEQCLQQLDVLLDEQSALEVGISRAQGEAWLGGDIRRRWLASVPVGCEDQSLPLLEQWNNVRSVQGGSRWQSIPLQLERIRLHIRQGSYFRASGELRQLAKQDPLFVGLDETFRLLSAQGPSGGSEGI
ncbi:MAG: hypothetical protein ACKO6N_08465 [Myxococcota bacterium]